MFDFSGVNIGITICEDIWKERAVEASVAAGAQIIININSSPFHAGKVEERYQLVSNKARKLNTPIIYVNQVGGQDELVFDGGSFCVNADGALMQRAECFIEHLGIVQVVPSNDGNVAFALDAGAVAVAANEHESIYQGRLRE